MWWDFFKHTHSTCGAVHKWELSGQRCREEMLLCSTASTTSPWGLTPVGEDEDHSQQSDCGHSRECRNHSEGAHSHCEGPQGDSAEGLQSHQRGAESSWEEEEKAPG